MPVTSVSQANSKTAEFARLFDIFNRVATRRARVLAGEASSTCQVISADDIANVPTEFVPMLKNLSTVLSSRALCEEARMHQRPQAASTSIDTATSATTEQPTPRGDINGTGPPEGDVEEEEPGKPSFPLGERYPFTFKLMLHKLYDLDEWGDKVKHAVEMSKSQFKPLAKRVQNVVRDATASIKERGEKRSSIAPAQPKSSCATMGDAKPDASRVLKKRCVGRRKSISGLASAGIWVYDAAVSAAEVVGPRSTLETTRSGTKETGTKMENCVRHQSLTTLQEMPSGDFARRKANDPVSLLEVPEPISHRQSPAPSAKSVQQTVGTATKSVKRRSSLASVFASESCKSLRATAKPPLDV